MKIVFDANGVRVTGNTNTPVICSDVMRACGYVPTGVARQFNVFPSYRLVRIPSKKRRMAVVDMAHAVEWLRYKNRRCRLPDNRKCKQVVAEFAQVWLNGLAKESKGAFAFCRRFTWHCYSTQPFFVLQCFAIFPTYKNNAIASLLV